MSIIEKLRKVIISLPQYIRASIDIKAKSKLSNDIEIYIYLQEKDVYYEDYGRYLYLLLRFLTFTEGKVALVKKITFKDYYKMGIYGKKIYNLDNLVLAKKLPENTEEKIFIYDRDIHKWTSKTWKKSIHLELNIALPIPSHDDWVFMPYTMHPSTYSTEQYSNIKSLQNMSRRIRLLFVGNVTHDCYANTDSKSVFGKFKIMTRATAINTVNSYLSDEILAIKDWQHMEVILNDEYQQKAIILETDKISFKVPQTKWLEVLAKSDFFLCPPGVTMPLCHNAIESMSVGTIPIINYPNWFFPSLNHLENCIKFTTKEDLIEAIKLVMNMEKPQIEQLQKNVIEYYKKYLSCDSFLANTIYNDKPKLTVFMTTQTDYIQDISKDSIILN